jgi:hypothetical protein
MNIILSLILSVYTNRTLLSVIITDDIDFIGHVVGMTNEIYRILKKRNSLMTWNFFRWFYRRNDRGIQIGISVQWRDPFTIRITDGYTNKTCLSVIPSVKANISTLCRLSPPLFLLLLPHHNSPLLNCKQPPTP